MNLILTVFFESSEYSNRKALAIYPDNTGVKKQSNGINGTAELVDVKE